MALSLTFIISLLIYLVTSKGGNKGGGGGGGSSGKGGKGTSTEDTSPTSGSSSGPVAGSTVNECARHRKPWNELSIDEQQLYIDGFLQLSSLGKMETFTMQHASEISGPQAHSTAAFLPWHRYFLIEVENAFRSLGESYECFAMPYWDWSYEATLTSNISDFEILNSGLGHFGDPGNDNCLDDDNFGQGNYVPHYCSNNDGECCLTRGNCQEEDTSICLFQTPAQMIEIVVRWDSYGTDEKASTYNGFRYNLEYGSHGQAHNYIGASTSGHLGLLLYSPDDPIFYLLHSFVDYQWALWQDCKDYDLVDRADVTDDIYGGSLPPPVNIWDANRGPSRIDDDLIYDVLGVTAWTRLYDSDNSYTYTPRDMHNISDWGVSYEKGSFWESADVDTACPDINEDWFYDTDDEQPVIAPALIFGKYVPDAVVVQNRFDESPKQKSRRKARESYSGQYAKTSIELLKEKYRWRDASVLRDKEMIHTWSEMTCEFNQLSLDKPCKRPKYFDDCEDMIINQQTGDIDITLDELLDKVKGSQCMIATRRQFYNWAMDTHTLLSLCRGDYDIFCDDSFKVKKEEEETCIENIGKVIERQSNGINAAHSGISNNNLDLIGSSVYNGNNNGIPEVQRIVLSAVINGLVIIFIIAFVAVGRICYMFYFSDNAISMSLQNVSNKINYGKYGKLSSSDESDFDQQEEDEIER